MKLAPTLSALLLLALAGCAAPTAAPQPGPEIPAHWQAPLPHQGSLTDLSQWWQQQGDPLLVALIESAQQQSPTVATAASRIAQARASRTTAGAALLPTLDANLSASREPAQTAIAPGGPPSGLVATTITGGLQAAWEIDLFGANRASRDAAQARLDGAQAQWHDARVSVAAEVANLYSSLRSCERLLQISQADATSRSETARLADLAAQAGFQAPAAAALARASAAAGRGRATQQRALCDIDTKGLVALSGWQEPDLRSKLALASTDIHEFAPLSVASVPAQALSQRPDLFNAEREVAAASADLGSAQAQRYPRLSLRGSIGALRYRAAGMTFDTDTWAIGPIALSLPLFDGGRSAANVASAEARYVEAAALYRSKVRQAVREVEEALVNLQSTAQRSDDAKVASEGYRASFTATQARYQSGLANLVELEDARRTALAADTALASLQRERRAAWVALYRAMGGGWSATDTAQNTATPTAAVTGNNP